MSTALNQIICGDCRSVLKDIPQPFTIVTDPPFNVGYHYRKYNDSIGGGEYKRLLTDTISPPAVVVHYPESMFVVAEVIGHYPEKCVAWVYPSNTRRQWRMISWFGCTPDFSKVRQPYRNPNDKRVKKLVERGSTGAKLYDWWEINQVKNVSKEKTDHPCQMPLKVMERIIAITPGKIIVDPFCGSGTTCVVAKKLGRDYIGIDIDPAYCEIAREKLRGSK